MTQQYKAVAQLGSIRVATLIYARSYDDAVRLGKTWASSVGAAWLGCYNNEACYD